MSHSTASRVALVAVVGAGPAGIYATRKLTEAGHAVVLLNRDVRPGGLAEYGIYFNKYSMKAGLRKQFRKILETRSVHYVGNTTVGTDADISLAQMRELLRPDAIVIAAGAQGTKRLAIPGESATGVIHAKELVYHYNGLPPFSERAMPVGNNVIVVGIGNVMVDVAHYLIHELRVHSCTALARRGPGQRAYTNAEIKAVSANIDADSLAAEIARIGPQLLAAGEDPQGLLAELLRFRDEPPPEGSSPTRLRFRFLSQPVAIIVDAFGAVAGARVERTRLDRRGDELLARGTGVYDDLAADTVILAIGDRADARLGLPFAGSAYVTRPSEDPVNPGDEAYQCYDPAAAAVLPGVFVAGWSRRASEGLVGKARQDGERAAAVVNRYLSGVAPASADPNERVKALRDELTRQGRRVVTFDDVLRLQAREAAEAERRGREYFRFATNAEMLAAATPN
ncbi:MAG: FAD-dependent oxidoreductase [Candidatus Schekmanbacteria bacterium]|nr:FAD-dependent oxidoreductase [Candidatus Schekmanbacteria bacterium]